MSKQPKMIIRVSKTEFETDDGEIHQIPFELDEVPTVEEFQKIYKIDGPKTRSL